MQPILTFRKEERINSSDNSFGFCLLMSTPISFIASTATGLISGVGLDPALTGIHPSGAYFLKNPSAIWLLPAFSTHTKRIFFSLLCFPKNFMALSLYCSDDKTRYFSAIYFLSFHVCSFF